MSNPAWQTPATGASRVSRAGRCAADSGNWPATAAAQLHEHRHGGVTARRYSIGFALLVCLIVQPAYAQIYKWVDAQGVTHYGQEPPAAGSRGSKVLELAPDPGSNKEAQRQDQKSWQVQDQEFRARQAQAADAKKRADEKAEQEATKRRNACLQAQSALDTLDRARRIYHVNEAGERVYLTDDERVAERQQATVNVAQYCH